VVNINGFSISHSNLGGFLYIASFPREKSLSDANISIPRLPSPVQKSQGVETVSDIGKAARSRLSTYTVGICVTGRAPRLQPLLKSVLSGDPTKFALKKVVIIASDVATETLGVARSATTDSRVRLIEHEKRTGKADAINEIIRENESDFLVFVNADALVDSRSIPVLLGSIKDDERAGVISGRPVFETAGGIVSEVLNMMWTSHNLLSSDLNQSDQRNHGTDELMVVRSELLAELPPGVVNDGAYIAGRIRGMGFNVGFQPEATVEIDVPTRMTDVMRQRRRILFGHIQVKRLVGKAPRTLETMMFFNPSESLRIAVRALADRPRLILVLPVAGMVDLIAVSGALWDTLTSKNLAVWERYDQR
jgi:cellulose synthase/poly-beta-1,6-N-acetylglucosamine synthase-like glycosyltransferase